MEGWNGRVSVVGCSDRNRGGWGGDGMRETGESNVYYSFNRGILDVSHVWKMELRGHRSYVNVGETYVIDSSSASDDDGSGFEALEEDRHNSPSSLLVSLEAKLHEKGGSNEAQTKNGKNRGDVVVTKLLSKKVHDKRGCISVNRREVVENEGEGMVGVVLRHQCTLEAVCSLNFELEDFQKSAIEEIVWSPVLKYKPLVIDRHLARALVESWIPETKTIKIDYREVPFSVYDVALLTGLPIAGKQVTFEGGKGHLRLRK
ncbi:hypothetical protein Cgig2_002649 [Carnegiea gigantea]|uniref:Uncharacterized protein n=1 Tax=Carnegiea gigantea TaxID=171969 RepID=A0A9Q1GK18_9CARY|nr:hypothetical protein Cgig2_002649 [Carnegiea gigantea]